MSDFLAPVEMASITGGRWLETPPAPLQGVGTDSREPLAGRLFVALRGDRFDGHDHVAGAASAGAAAVMVSREVACPGPRLLVPDTLQALQSLATAWRRRLPNALCVAITGSAGKTTVRRLVESACRQLGPTHASPRSFNNHLGVPLALLGAPADTRYLVVEIGMNRPGEIEPLSRMASPRSVIVTNAGTAHLGGMGSREAIAREKVTIARGLQAAGTLVVHGDQEHLLAAALQERLPPAGRLVGFGERGLNAFRLRGRQMLPDGGQRVTVDMAAGPVQLELGLPGAHNAMNAVGVVAALASLGLPIEAIRQGLARVEPADMRLVRTGIHGVDVFNDAYNANPDSVLAAVATFAELTAGVAGRRVVALGDMLELGEQGPALHMMVGEAVARAFDGQPPALAILCGSLVRHTAEAIRSAAPACEVVWEADLALRAGDLAALLRTGDALLVKGSRGSGMERLVAALQSLEKAKNAAPAGR